MQPTLVIGLGSSGLEAINELQRWMYVTFGKNRLPIFQYVCFDSDLRYTPDCTPDGNEIDFHQLRVDGYQHAMEELQQNPSVSADWIDPKLPQQVLGEAFGAGGVRPIGRLLLWGGGNFNIAYQAISRAWQDIVRPNAVNELPPDLQQNFVHEPVVYIIGTLGGGTCSGTFIDIGYMVQQICGAVEQIETCGIFFVPNHNTPSSMAYANAYGALSDLDYFVKEGGTYYENWPINVPVQRRQSPPFRSVYLVAPEYAVQRYGDMQFGRCIKLAGLALFCNLAGMSQSRQARLVDARNQGFGYYGTFGISAIMYPKYELLEAGACKLGIELCDRWTHDKVYGPADQKMSIDKSTITGEAERFLEEKIDQAFGILNAGQTDSVWDRVRADVQRLLEKQDEIPSDFLVSRFSSDRVGGTYYSLVNANLTQASDYLISAIADQAAKILDETQNLEYTKTYLEGLGTAIGRLQSYWTAIGVPDSAAEWRSKVSQEVGHVLSSPHWWLAQKRNALSDRLDELAKKLKMFCARKILSQIAEGLNNGRLACVVDGKIDLPSIAHVNELIETVKNTRKLLAARLDVLDSELKDNQMPIWRIWNSGSFDQDLKNLLLRHCQAHGEATFELIRNSTSMGGRSLWRFLDEEKPTELLLKMKTELQRSIQPRLQNGDLNAAIQDETRVAEYTSRALATLLPLQRDGIAGAVAPRFVVGAAARINQVTENFSVQFPAQSCAIPNFADAVVFYSEKGGFRPLDTVSIIDMAREKFETPPSGFQGTADVWQGHRRAYYPERHKRREQMAELMEFILDFAVIWKQCDGTFVAAENRWPSEIPLRIAQPISFTFKDELNLERDFEINPTNGRNLRQVAQRSDNCARLDAAVSTILAKITIDDLVNTFNEEIKPRLTAEGKNSFEVSAKADYYFGGKNSEVGWFIKRGLKRGAAHA